MVDPNPPENSIQNDTKSEPVKDNAGETSQMLTKKGLKNFPLDPDHLGIETIKVEPSDLLKIAIELKQNGFNYLQCQGGYDEGPGLNIVCFYNLIEIKESDLNTSPKEVRIKVFLKRDGDLKVPSLYSIYRGSDWQERETFDMYGVIFEGHPHPKRLLMPEDWKGWPLRKDYVQPDFYEMQDAY